MKLKKISSSARSYFPSICPEFGDNFQILVVQNEWAKRNGSQRMIESYSTFKMQFTAINKLFAILSWWN